MVFLDMSTLIQKLREKSVWSALRPENFHDLDVFISIQVHYVLIMKSI
jgi:hypothetical protein